MTAGSPEATVPSGSPEATVPSGSPEATVAWFHCFAGIAGDMALGSLIDAGADPGEVRSLLGRLALPAWELSLEEGQRGGIACTRAVVRTSESAGGARRTHRDIAALIGRASLPPRVQRRALAAFEALAVVEGRLHGTPPGDVHFHEVGGHDALVDIVGTAAALEVLGVDEICASAVATGTGAVRAAHGSLPNPAPATVRLLEGIPAYGRDVAVELTTPTGAALLASMCSSFGPMPPMEVVASGFGAGSHELDDLPNCTQVVVGRRPRASVGAGQGAWVLETNLDDVTGEQLGHAMAAVLAAGAFDAWVSPVVMKKGRPGHVLHVLTDQAHLDTLRAEIEHVTGTMGVRAVDVMRWPRARREERVVLDGATIRMKVTSERAKPEFDDVARAAAETGVSPREMASRAEEAWRAAQGNASPAAREDDTSATKSPS